MFGDAIAPRGGSVRLGTLIDLFAAMGIGAGALRTAMSRLVADGWTERTRAGRNSSYRLVGPGQSTFAAAAKRIYAGHPVAWDGHFRLVLHPQHSAVLAANGYGQAAPGLWVAPGPVFAPAEPITLYAEADAESARLLAARAWPLDRLAASFTRFNDAFATLPTWYNPTPINAMIARTLLIHDYRRIVLHSPSLPVAILPTDWPGHAARMLCAAAYKALLPASEAWLSAQGLPDPDSSPSLRFEEHVTGKN